jgi:hypothetical protein
VLTPKTIALLARASYTNRVLETLLRLMRRVVDGVRDVMSQEQIKYRQLSAKLIGSNVVSFRLEDETLVKVHVELARAGVAVDRKNPDGTPLYNISTAMRVDVETKDKTFYAPPPPQPTKSTSDKKGDQSYTT